MKTIRIIFGIFIIFNFISSLSFSQKIDDFDIILDQCKRSYSGIRDYSCDFSRKELINGELKIERNILFKFMKENHFYMKWTEGKNGGMESIFVSGKHDNKLVVKPNGLFSFLRVAVDPIGKTALKNNRHPVYDADIGHFIKLFEKEYQRARNDKNCKFTFEPDPVINSRSMTAIKAIFPENNGYYGHIIYIYIDKYFHLPVKVMVYDWKNVLIEEYQYDNLKINISLSEKDFETREPDLEY